jgi:hypothetical protein
MDADEHGFNAVIPIQRGDAEFSADTGYCFTQRLLTG